MTGDYSFHLTISIFNVSLGLTSIDWKIQQDSGMDISELKIWKLGKNCLFASLLRKISYFPKYVLV